jgi:hypothetical protein
MLLSDDCDGSSAIERAAYDSQEKVLFVFFKSDENSPRAWAYKEVPQSCFDGLTQASSRGRYFHEHIRDQFPADRLFHAAALSLLTQLTKNGCPLLRSWVEELAGTPAAEDPLGLFF